MKLNPVLIGSLLALIAVVAGAFGAHALKEVLNPEQLSSYSTAVRYQMIHALALLIISRLNLAPKISQSVYWCMLIGVILFSGSIYGLHLGPLITRSNWYFLGPITPIGGLLLIIGWFLVLLSQLKKRKKYTK
jgi:uncharacterized membrane protein YgdD (TMEM256/DUF423 family)